MRIISQNGISDYPYDEIGLSIGWRGDKEEYYIYWNSVNRQLSGRIAIYSTLDKAKKAMEMLHSACCGEIYLNHGDYEVIDIDLSQEIEKKIREEMLKPHFLEIKPNNPAVECKIFRFPADEELEC